MAHTLAPLLDVVFFDTLAEWVSVEGQTSGVPERNLAPSKKAYCSMLIVLPLKLAFLCHISGPSWLKYSRFSRPQRNSIVPTHF